MKEIIFDKIESRKDLCYKEFDIEETAINSWILDQAD